MDGHKFFLYNEPGYDIDYLNGHNDCSRNIHPGFKIQYRYQLDQTHGNEYKIRNRIELGTEFTDGTCFSGYRTVNHICDSGDYI